MDSIYLSKKNKNPFMHMNYFQKYLLKFTNVFGWHIHMFDLQEMLRLFIFNKRLKKEEIYIFLGGMFWF